MALDNKKAIFPRNVTFQIGNHKRQNITIGYQQDTKKRDEVILMRVNHGMTSFISLPVDAIDSITEAMLDMKREIEYYGLKSSAT